MDTVDPKRQDFQTEQLDPSLAKDRSDSELPRCRRSNTASPEPSRTPPKLQTARELPARANARMLMLLPR
jgi:hypothetical protein